ncbi:MAG: hypothetical protein IE891_10920 [Flavobacteriaceae bacterium]|nr:hypothetical protein [Flavobacteriaceae bacterium]
MNNKFKTPLRLLLLGMAITIVGALFKIMHWPAANILLGIGLICEAVGLFMLISNAMNKLKDK